MTFEQLALERYQISVHKLKQEHTVLESELVKKVHKYAAKNDILYINLQKTNLSGIP